MRPCQRAPFAPSTRARLQHDGRSDEVVTPVVELRLRNAAPVLRLQAACTRRDEAKVVQSFAQLLS